MPWLQIPIRVGCSRGLYLSIFLTADGWKVKVVRRIPVQARQKDVTIWTPSLKSATTEMRTLHYDLDPRNHLNQTHPQSSLNLIKDPLLSFLLSVRLLACKYADSKQAYS
jgi:hypothetical protein